MYGTRTTLRRTWEQELYMSKENVFNLAEKFGFIRYKDGIDWSSNYDKELVALVESLLKEGSNQKYLYLYNLVYGKNKKIVGQWLYEKPLSDTIENESQIYVGKIKLEVSDD
jgi:hypothetical protein